MATKPQLDSIRGLYTLNIEALESYQIGNTKMQADSFEEPPPESAMNVLVVASETSLSEIVRRTERLARVQQIVLSLDQRVQTVESRVQNLESDQKRSKT